MNDTYQQPQNDMIWLLAGAGVALGALYIWNLIRRRKQVKNIEPFLPSFPSPPINQFIDGIPYVPIDGATPGDSYVVKLVSPWGQSIDLVFSQEEWDMMKNLSEMSGETMEEVVIDIALERRKNGLL